MDLIVEHEKGYRFKVSDGKFTVTAGIADRDSPSERDNMSPAKLFVASLGMCVGTYVRKFCERHDIPYERMEIKLNYQKAKSPSRISEVNIEVKMPTDVPKDYRSGLIKYAGNCFVKQSIEQGLDLDLSIE